MEIISCGYICGQIVICLLGLKIVQHSIGALGFLFIYIIGNITFLYVDRM